MTPLWPPRAPKLRLVKPKAITYELIARDSDVGRPIYERLDHLLRDFSELKPLVDAEARIVLAFATSWKRDVDGRLVLGKCKKASDLDRELAPYDFIVLLNRAWWFDTQTSNLARDALLFHELQHAGVAYDEKGHVKEDERGRAVFRTVKHDIEEFTPTITRFGLYKKDLEAFGEVCAAAKESTEARGWVSYSAVREQLQLAGVTIPLEFIMQWSDDQRREAFTWAIIRVDARAQPLLDREPMATPLVVDAALADLARQSGEVH